MSVDDQGLEVLKKSGEEVTPGSKADYLIKTSMVGIDSSGLFANISVVKPSQGVNSLAVTAIEKANPLFINWFTETDATSGQTISAPTVVGTYTIVLTDATKYGAGDNLLLLSPSVSVIYRAFVLSKAGNTLTMDTPLNAIFPTGSASIRGTVDMNVDGSTTQHSFTIRGVVPIPEPSLEVVIHRMILICQTSAAVDLSKFGNLTALTRGLLLRQTDGVTNNIFNVKTNGEIASVCYDWSPYLATNPQQGQDGFAARITFGGNEKMGTSIVVKEGESLELVIQDDLTGLTKFRAIGEGYVRFL